MTCGAMLIDEGGIHGMADRSLTDGGGIISTPIGPAKILKIHGHLIIFSGQATIQNHLLINPSQVIWNQSEEELSTYFQNSLATFNLSGSFYFYLKEEK